MPQTKAKSGSPGPSQQFQNAPGFRLLTQSASKQKEPKLIQHMALCLLCPPPSASQNSQYMNLLQDPQWDRVAISRAFFDTSLEFLKKRSSEKKKSHPSLEGPRKGRFPPCPQKRGPYGNTRPFPEPSFTYCSGFPVKEPPPLQVPLIQLPQRDAPFLQLSFIHLPKSLVMSPLQVPQRGNYGQRCSFPVPTSTHPLIKTKSHLSLILPGKGAPLHVPPTGTLRREMLCLHRQWYILSLISLRVPS